MNPYSHTLNNHGGGTLALPWNCHLCPRQALTSPPCSRRRRSPPQTSLDDPEATTRRGTAATTTSALGPYLEAASDSLLYRCCTTVYTQAFSQTSATGSTANFSMGGFYLKRPAPTSSAPGRRKAQPPRRCMECRPVAPRGGRAATLSHPGSGHTVR